MNDSTSVRHEARTGVSVIIPVYNAEAFLSRAVESVLNQSYRDFELILVDDQSTDGSRMICERYAAADNRITVVSRNNGGPAAARNTGLQHAVGKWVFFLDADDFIEARTLQILISAGLEYQPDLVMANFRKLENNGTLVDQRVAFHPDNVSFRNHILHLSPTDIHNYVRHFLKHPSNHLVSYCWARLYKRSIVQSAGIASHEKMRLFEDFVFNLDYLRHTRKVVFINEHLYTYTMHNQHVSVSMSIVDADSLLHDMRIFRQRAVDFLQHHCSAGKTTSNIEREVGHALVHYVIIFLVRSCRLADRHNYPKVFAEIKKIVCSSIYKESLRHYQPQKGNSRILPLLTRLRWVPLIIPYARYKSYRRYGRLRSPA